jgi:transcriptional regulator with XRE-family HTH domain
MYDSNWSIRKIAEVMGISKSIIVRWLNEKVFGSFSRYTGSLNRQVSFAISELNRTIELKLKISDL